MKKKIRHAFVKESMSRVRKIQTQRGRKTEREVKSMLIIFFEFILPGETVKRTTGAFAATA
jgi:hypothetical protein